MSTYILLREKKINVGPNLRLSRHIFSVDNVFRQKNGFQTLWVLFFAPLLSLKNVNTTTIAMYYDRQCNDTIRVLGTYLEISRRSRISIDKNILQFLSSFNGKAYVPFNVNVFCLSFFGFLILVLRGNMYKN